LVILIVNGFDMWDQSIQKYEFPYLILGNGKFIARGGFWDGRINISPVEGEPNVTYINCHYSTVTILVADKKEQYVITGSKGGDVIIWNLLSE
jgi:hypothetical protein